MRTYPVLARVSPGYSEPKGTFPRVTHPSATLVLLRAFDLHVLSLPPAFALSQDQTLKFEILIQLDHYISLTSPKHIDRLHLHESNLGLNLSKRRTAEVIGLHPSRFAPAGGEARKDPAAYVSLSSRFTASNSRACAPTSREPEGRRNSPIPACARTERPRVV